MESHCSQNARAQAPPEARGVSVCARQWELLPGCPVAVFFFSWNCVPPPSPRVSVH